MTPDIRAPRFTNGSSDAASYYPEGYIQDAMRIFHASAPFLQSAVFSVCDQAQMQQFTYGELKHEETNSTFLKSFMQGIFLPFTESLPKGLQSATVDRFGSDPGELYNKLQSVLNGNPANDRHVDLIARHMRHGWKSILREYGIFTVLPMRISKIVHIFAELAPKLKAEEVKHQILLLESNSFTNTVVIDGVDGIVHCPASGIVQKSISLCVGYNTALVKTGIYGLSRVNLVDEGGTFQKADAMQRDYESIMLQLA